VAVEAAFRHWNSASPLQLSVNARCHAGELDIIISRSSHFRNCAVCELHPLASARETRDSIAERRVKKMRNQEQVLQL
jgi:Holliday junction resolvase-like predicted endonuclease